MFNHVDLNLEPLKRETIDGVRYYSIPEVDELVKLVSIIGGGLSSKLNILIVTFSIIIEYKKYI